jgi:hypothetical protein
LLVLQLERPDSNAADSADLVSGSLYVSLSSADSSENLLRDLNIKHLSVSQVQKLLHTSFKFEETLELVQNRKPVLTELFRAKLSENLNSLSTFVFAGVAPAVNASSHRFVVPRDALCDFSWLDFESSPYTTLPFKSAADKVSDVSTSTPLGQAAAHWFGTAFDSVKTAVIKGLKGPSADTPITLQLNASIQLENQENVAPDDIAQWDWNEEVQGCFLSLHVTICEFIIHALIYDCAKRGYYSRLTSFVCGS